jgi:hypothetical protein
MSRHAAFTTLSGLSTPECLVIEDVGDHSRQLTVTNDAEWVVEQIATMLNGRRLEYIDSEGNRDEIVVRDGRFAGFAPSGGRHQ